VNLHAKLARYDGLPQSMFLYENARINPFTLSIYRLSNILHP
jgi:hypothetical protein